MHNQNQTNASSVDAAQAPHIQPGQYQQDARPPYVANYPPAAAAGNRDGQAPALSNLFGNLNIQNQRGLSKYGTLKGNVPVAMPPNVDMSAAHRPPYNGQVVLLPNGSIFGGMPPVSPFAVPSQDQVGQIPYLPTVYPSLNPGCSMVPGAVQGYTWPYLVNYDMQDFSGQRRSPWVSAEDHKGAGSSAAESGSSMEYIPTPPTMDNSTYSGYAYNAIPPQLSQPCLPLQMMKTSNGYILQDLEALTQQDPPIPRAVPAMWTNPSELTLAKCLENREGITNVYIRGFLPETTDETLHSYASRFGKIDRCKAIVDLDTGLCKGFGFVQYFNFESCENCIRGFFYLGYQASFAQKSRNSRLKDLEDRTSTNIYCTNVPIDWTEADLRRHFEPYRVVSEKISRDEKTGVSKEVGFARFETREVAEKVLSEFHNVVGKDGVKLLLRFADTKAQKILKQQSNERRAYRAGEYNFSVEVVQGTTPSPSLHRLQQTASHLSPNSQVSYTSPMGVGSTWTPATSISPSGVIVKNPMSTRLNAWSSRTSLATLENTPVYRGRISSANRSSMAETISAESSKTVVPGSPCGDSKSVASSPRKENIKAGSLSPISSRREVVIGTPRSSI